jgi:hypothetical protein
MTTICINKKPIYLLKEKAEIIEARDYIENNWTNEMRPQLVQLALVCMKYFNCKLIELN